MGFWFETAGYRIVGYQICRVLKDENLEIVFRINSEKCRSTEPQVGRSTRGGSGMNMVRPILFGRKTQPQLTLNSVRNRIFWLEQVEREGFYHSSVW